MSLFRYPFPALRDSRLRLRDRVNARGYLSQANRSVPTNKSAARCPAVAGPAANTQATRGPPLVGGPLRIYNDLIQEVRPGAKSLPYLWYLYERMKYEEIQPNHRTYVLLLSRLCQLYDRQEPATRLLDVFREARAHGFIPTFIELTALARVLCDRDRVIRDRLEQLDARDLTATTRGQGPVSKIHEERRCLMLERNYPVVLELVRLAQKLQIYLDAYTYDLILRSAADHADAATVLAVYADMQANMIRPTPFTAGSLIRAHTVLRDLDALHRTFEEYAVQSRRRAEMTESPAQKPHGPVYVLSAYITGLTELAGPDAALAAIQPQAHALGLPPDTPYYNLVMGHLVETGQVEAAHELFGRMTDGDAPNAVPNAIPTEATYNLVLRGLVGRADYRAARRIYHHARQRNRQVSQDLHNQLIGLALTNRDLAATFDLCDALIRQGRRLDLGLVGPALTFLRDQVTNPSGGVGSSSQTLANRALTAFLRAACKAVKPDTVAAPIGTSLAKATTSATSAPAMKIILDTMHRQAPSDLAFHARIYTDLLPRRFYENRPLAMSVVTMYHHTRDGVASAYQTAGAASMGRYFETLLRCANVLQDRPLEMLVSNVTADVARLQWPEDIKRFADLANVAMERVGKIVRFDSASPEGYVIEARLTLPPPKLATNPLKTQLEPSKSVLSGATASSHPSISDRMTTGLAVTATPNPKESREVLALLKAAQTPPPLTDLCSYLSAASLRSLQTDSTEFDAITKVAFSLASRVELASDRHDYLRAIHSARALHELRGGHYYPAVNIARSTQRDGLALSASVLTLILERAPLHSSSVSLGFEMFALLRTHRQWIPTKFIEALMTLCLSTKYQLDQVPALYEYVHGAHLPTTYRTHLIVIEVALARGRVPEAMKCLEEFRATHANRWPRASSSRGAREAAISTDLQQRFLRQFYGVDSESDLNYLMRRSQPYTKLLHYFVERARQRAGAQTVYEHLVTDGVPLDATLTLLVMKLMVFYEPPNLLQATALFRALRQRAPPSATATSPSEKAPSSSIHATGDVERQRNRVASEAYASAAPTSTTPSRLAHYNVLIEGYGVQGRDLQQALAWFTHITTDGLQPNYASYRALQQAFATAGDAANVQRIEDIIKETNGNIPVSYATMVLKASGEVGAGGAAARRLAQTVNLGSLPASLVEP
ncbi:hypothetical protein IWQ60_009719 [Tieghemiomyces parasiticus]|uniref:Pentacotripeptide-repeat region of PRORP domain-containing protein n=1 Tax=Tieghemiomyces parasiticus TaxID=78921 RepID=A0A9W7ZV85_9FUNG|nr:hypothetical protein IWQ60_009719 [Tieghemiomyces parasiticus]